MFFFFFKSLPEKKLVDLYNELKMHDKKEGDLKKIKLSGLDEDGLKTAQLEEKFMGVYDSVTRQNIHLWNRNEGGHYDGILFQR